MKFGLNRSKKISLPRLVVVCGPTAVGKTAHAIALAKKINGEVISADSRQVYKYLNIGTAKVTQEEMDGVPHHLLDIFNPDDPCSVTRYKYYADQAIQSIIARGKVPIICGGTGMYIDAIVYGKEFPQVLPNKDLRKQLESLSTLQLFAHLAMLDPKRAATIDRANRVRLVRAIEIAESLGSVPEVQEKTSLYDVEWVYLDLPDDELRNRIHTRNVARLDNGLIEEVQDLHSVHKLSWERMEALGLEYRYVGRFVRGEIETKQELLEMLDLKIWQYAKRQRTWFKKYGR